MESMVGIQHTCIPVFITRHDIIWKLWINTVLIIYFKYNTFFNVVDLSIIPGRRHTYWNSAPSNYVKLLTRKHLPQYASIYI